LLDDIRTAAEFIIASTNGKRFTDYEQDVFLRLAVERQFTSMVKPLSGCVMLTPTFWMRLQNNRKSLDSGIDWHMVTTKISTMPKSGE
jgi:hypothetical protein